MVLSPFVLALLGSSLTTGRLSADWAPQLTRDLGTYPEAKGPISVLNLGKGSQNSAWGVTQIPTLVGLQPTHILFEGFAINDCIDFGGGPVISRAQHITNIQTMIAGFQAGIPGVDLTIQTMNPVSAAGAAIRPDLANYYADEIATGTVAGIQTLDNYAGWPKPLPDGASYGAAVGYTAFGGTWNPADKNAGITLSGGNLTAANTSGVNDLGVRGTASFNAGKHTFMTTVGAADGRMSIGIATAGGSLGTLLGGTGGTYGYASTGAIYAASGTPTAFPATYTAGDVVVTFVDMTLLKVWWSVNGFCINGDPVNNIGGTAIAAGTYFPAISMSDVSPGSSATSAFVAYPGDGLHPLRAGYVDTYLDPNVLAFARARMAAKWP